MSHKVTITRSELTEILTLSYGEDEVIDLKELASTFTDSESKVRTAEFFEDLLVSTYALHGQHIDEVVTLPLDVEDPQDLAVPLIRALSEGKLLKYIDSNQIVLHTGVEEVIEEMLTNGVLTDPSEYSPDNIRLALLVTDDLTEELPEHFNQYDCTKIRIII